MGPQAGPLTYPLGLNMQALLPTHHCRGQTERGDKDAGTCQPGAGSGQVQQGGEAFGDERRMYTSPHQGGC